MNSYEGVVWASHHNCRELVDNPRQLSDDQIKALIDRGAVIGSAFDAWMLSPNWIRGQSTPTGDNVYIENVADHIDHICQIAGNSSHCGIGSDLDGGFGTEQSPSDLNTIADIGALEGILSERGYSGDDINAIMYGNFISFCKKNLPQE